MEIWILGEVGKAVSIRFVLLACLVLALGGMCTAAPLDDWLRNPCQYTQEKRSVRHSRDAKVQEKWNVQLTLTRKNYNNLVISEMETMYNKTDKLKGVKPRYKLPKSPKKKQDFNYFALQKYLIVMDKLSKQENLPLIAGFDPNKRRKMFEGAVNMTRTLLCEVQDSLKNGVNTKEFKINVESPKDFAGVYAQDRVVLESFKKFLDKWHNNNKRRKAVRNKNQNKNKKKQAKVTNVAHKPKQIRNKRKKLVR